MLLSIARGFGAALPWSQLHWCAFRNDARGIYRLLTPGGFCCRRLPSPDVRDKVRARFGSA